MPTQIPVETEPACAPTVPELDTALIQKADMPQS
jgi:hypothetical protein